MEVEKALDDKGKEVPRLEGVTLHSVALRTLPNAEQSYRFLPLICSTAC